MKRIMMILMAAVLMSTSAVAQEEKQGDRPEKKFDKTEMAKRRTDRMVKDYGLNEKQAKQLFELNNKYADKMRPHGPRPHHGPEGGPGRPPKDGKDMKGERPEPPKDKDGKHMAPPKDAKHMEHHKKMGEAMKAYDAELKKIMTEDQFKAYQTDMEKRREHHGRRQKD